MATPNVPKSDSNMVAEPSERSERADAAMQEAAAAAGARRPDDPQPGQQERNKERRIEFDPHLPAKVQNVIERQDANNDAIVQLQERVRRLEEHAKKSEGRVDGIEREGFSMQKDLAAVQGDMTLQKADLTEAAKRMREFTTPQNLQEHIGPIIDRATDVKIKAMVDKCSAELETLKKQCHDEFGLVKTKMEDSFNKFKGEVAVIQQDFDEQKNWNTKVKDYLGNLEQERPLEGQTIMNVFNKLKDEMAAIQQDFDEQKNWNAKVRNYLGNLEQERPLEGHTIMKGLQILETKVDNIQAAAGTGASAGGSGQDPNGGKQFVRGELRRIRVALDEQKGRVDAITKRLDEKCHCVHVDHHDKHLDALQLQIDTLAEAVNASPPSCLPCGSIGVNLFGTPARPSAAGPFSVGTGLCCDQGPGGDGGAGGPSGGQPSGNAGDGGLPWYIASRGGNGECHCRHVTELQWIAQLLTGRVGTLEQHAVAQLENDGGVPFIPAGVTHHAVNTPQRLNARQKLTLGPLGRLESGRLFEDKMTSHEGFQFDGQKGGDRWKGKLERYFISKVPALKAILKWAEKEDMDVVTEDLLEGAVGHAIKLEHREVMNSEIWGFLSNCVSGEAETIFKRADSLNGLDAWRRIIRHIDHGRSIRLEALRTEVRSLHLKPIKNLESVALGIAEFENKITEYVEAGGRKPDDKEMKDDLLALLPGDLRENLLWHATDPGDFATFRNMVQAQAAKVLLDRRRLPVHTVADEDEDFDMRNISNVDELMAFIRKSFAGKNKQNRRNQTAPQKTGDPPRQPRGPIRCANCGDEHPRTECNKPIVPVSERKCWTCGKKGCISSRCPEKKKSRDVRNVESEEDMPCFGLGMAADSEGFTPVRKGAKPQPRGATLGDFFSHSTKFQILGTVSDEEEKYQQKMKRRAEVTRDQNVALQNGESLDCADVFSCTPGTKQFQRLFPDLKAEPTEQPRTTKPGDDIDLDHLLDQIELLEHEETDDELIANTANEETEVEVAADTGAVDNVIGEGDVPSSVRTVPNTTGRHFTGAGGDRIRQIGTCKTLMRDSNGREIGCQWRVADVTRALHSISRIAGPEDGDGDHDVLFNNKRGVVVPPGTVDKVLLALAKQKIKPITEYKRKGGLYVAKMKLSGFARPGQGQ